MFVYCLFYLIILSWILQISPQQVIHCYWIYYATVLLYPAFKYVICSFIDKLLYIVLMK